MVKMVVNIENINIGKYDVDSIVFQSNGSKKEICFDKSVNVGNYLGKTVKIKEVGGLYKIYPHDKTDRPPDVAVDTAKEKANPKK